LRLALIGSGITGGLRRWSTSRARTSWSRSCACAKRGHIVDGAYQCRVPVHRRVAPWPRERGQETIQWNRSGSGTRV